MTSTIATTPTSDLLPAVSCVSAQQVEFLEMIWSYDLSMVRARLVLDGVVSGDMVDDVLCEYRKFMALLRLGYWQIGMYSKPIDEVWHTHILFTRDYAAFCNLVFGEFVHHEPAMNGVPTDVTRGTRESFLSVYRQHFGEINPLWVATNSNSPCVPTGVSDGLVCEPTGARDGVVCEPTGLSGGGAAS